MGIRWLWVKIPTVPPVNIPIPTKRGSRMGGAATPKWDYIGFEPQPVVLLVPGSWVRGPARSLWTLEKLWKPVGNVC